MGKSKYPNKLDTSLEIPAVRDNIVEVGSDVLNSLRSAIFNIERTLGINPQGATGNSVASRINTSLDGNGNILKEALDKAGLLSGPITNSDVSKAAGIDESKLRLEYPTTLLQDEISQIMLQIKTITDTLEELAYLFAAHTHLESKNRHKAQAITVDKIENNSSNLGITSAEQQTSQELFEALFSSHINYDGSDISLSNRSHKADQVHFDNENVSAYVDSNDVQGAIEDVLRETSGQLERHQNLQHSNGRLRSSAMLGSEEEDLGVLLVGESDISFFKYSSEESSRLTTINFEDPPDALPIQKSDIVRIYNGTDGTTADYQIYSATYSALNKLESVQVFGMINRNSTVLDKVKIFANANAEANPAGLLVSARPFPSATNLDVLQVANPDASAIITRKIRPSEISINNRYITIVIDEAKEISVDLFNGTTPGGQSLDTIVKALNESFAESAASALAYRVDYDDDHSSEIAIVHSLPSTSSNSPTLSIKRGTDDAIDSMGLGHIEDQVVSEGFGSEFYIQGEGYSGLSKKLEQAGLSLTEGTSNVTSYSSGIDFTEYGITDGDLLIITNTAKDDGTYVIENVSESSLTVDADQLAGGAWASSASDSSIFYIYKNSISLKDYNFLVKYGTSNSAIFDVFLDKNREIFYDVRLEHGIVTLGAGESLIAPCDFTGDVSLYTVDSPASLKASLKLDGKIELTLDNGPAVEMASLKTSYITLKSGLYDISLRVYIEDSDYISSKITTDLAGEPIEISMVGYEGVNKEENLMLARMQYDSAKSRVSGAGGLVPRVFKTLQLGVTSDKDLSTNALNKVYQGPIRETRSNGVTKGLLLTPADTPIDDNKYVVNIAGGTCFVKGRRFSYPGYTDLISDIDSTLYDKVFIAINEWGEIVFAGADSSGGAGACICPFNADSFCILSCLEFDNVTVDAIDLRLFIDNLDLKVLNSITVSPEKGMGHFAEFGEAIKYAKRFSDMFPKAGVPTVHLKSGTHKVILDTKASSGAYTEANVYQEASYAGLWLNFPVNITGEGHSTVLDIMKVFSDIGEEGDDRHGFGNPIHGAHIYIAGPGVSSTPNGNGGVLDEGFISISNLRMKDCSVLIIDPWTENLDGNKLNWGVKVDRVIFDRSSKPDYATSAAGVLFWSYDGTGIENVGNLVLSNCELLNAYGLASFVGAEIKHRNIMLLNNVSRGTGDGVLDGIYHRLVYNNGAGDLFNASSANNIEFRGNINADSTNTANTKIEGDYSWGDKVSRNLSVGDDILVGGKIGVGTIDPGYDVDIDGDLNVTGSLLVDGETLVASSGGVINGDMQINGSLLVAGTDNISGSLGNPGTVGQLIVRSNGSDRSMYIDGTELQARDDDEDEAALMYLNRLGGSVYVGTTGTQDGIFRCYKPAEFKDSVTIDGNLSCSTITSNLEGNLEGTTTSLSNQINIGDNIYTPARLNIDTSQFGGEPAIFLEQSAEIAANGRANGTQIMPAEAKNIKLGWWDRDQGGNSPGGDNFYEVFKLHNKSGRIQIFSNDSNAYKSGIWIHKRNTHEFDKGFWSIYYDDDNDTLRFRWAPMSGTTSNTYGSTKAYLDPTAAGAQVLNFTGQHRSVPEDGFDPTEHVGKIVSSAGRYLNADLKESVSINEALPCIALSSKANDKKVFGVISSCEDKNDSSRHYQQGVFVSVIDKSPGDNRVIVNSLGEGGIWVCDENGDLENGDYITTASVPGLGAKQDDDLLHNYTVAKITCDCSFDLNSSIYKCVEFEHNGKIYKKAFVGCTYHCG